jgi:hypothetical protein
MVTFSLCVEQDARFQVEAGAPLWRAPDSALAPNFSRAGVGVKIMGSPGARLPVGLPA